MRIKGVRWGRVRARREGGGIWRSALSRESRQGGGLVEYGVWDPRVASKWWMGCKGEVRWGRRGRSVDGVRGGRMHRLGAAGRCEWAVSTRAVCRVGA